MSGLIVSRRGLVAGAASLGGLILAGCDRLARAPSFDQILQSAQGLTYRSQRLLEAGGPLAREYAKSDISPVFKLNGTLVPTGDAYKAMADNRFADWKLVVDGMVARPLSLSLAQLGALPARTQITRHDCVEGWSAIGQWSGARLGPILQLAGLSGNARYIVFHCADNWGPGGDYYESIDLVDAFHPQTILAYALNGAPLEVGHGAPLRLRVERQLGYKQAKYVMRIEAVDKLNMIGSGKGGFWEDRGYEWYAGI
ncbi:MAG TPA: molybdopterin-binding protein [Caulobacteraceae bacterium]|jgi:DMSO/TMAO reductase YedYZ molybdopterin-dependent catalytic subunit|nr:molybdopterin-binding protein [Caulobacteraceae bacterium]